MTVVLAGSLAGGMALSERPSLAAGEAAAKTDPTFVVVQPGQTLWEIARVAAPGEDPRATIGRILDLNALSGVDIRAGQRLALP
jgi:LysM repeat protein